MTEAYIRHALIFSAYAIAAAWCSRAFAAVFHLRKLPHLLEPTWDAMPASEPSICVVVPARNEEPNIAATLASLLAQDYSNLKVLAINDRSDDRTGELIDSSLAASDGRLLSIHITELPNGWLGKTHAMHVAVTQSVSDYLLFTDADILFAPTIIRRALVYAERSGAEHIVVAPTPDIHNAGEGAMLGFLQVLGLWASRPWRIADPKAKRDFLGIGAFNLVRRDAFERVGGWEAQKLAVVEDLTLGRRLKVAEVAQRLVVAKGAVRVHWAAGLSGIIRVMTKNLFAVMFFQPALIVTSAVFIALFFLAPLFGLFWLATALPSAVCLICIALCFSAMSPITGVDRHYLWTYPLGAVAFIYAMFRSMLTVLSNGGVEWRGTHYSLAQLRANNRFSL